MKQNYASPLNWKLLFIALPLFPFFISALLNYLILAFACPANGSETPDYLWLCLSSWDTTKFAFSTSIMAFFIKKDLLEQKIVLPNPDKLEEIGDACTVFFVYGIFGFILFGLLLFVEIRLYDCRVEDLHVIYYTLTIMTYFIGISTIKKGFAIQKQLKLKSKSIL